MFLPHTDDTDTETTHPHTHTHTTLTHTHTFNRTDDDRIVFGGWARMAIPTTSVSIAEVKPPRVGESKPSAVIADVVIETAGVWCVWCVCHWVCRCGVCVCDAVCMRGEACACVERGNVCVCVHWMYLRCVGYHIVWDTNITYLLFALFTSPLFYALYIVYTHSLPCSYLVTIHHTLQNLIPLCDHLVHTIIQYIFMIITKNNIFHCTPFIPLPPIHCTPFIPSPLSCPPPPPHTHHRHASGCQS